MIYDSLDDDFFILLEISVFIKVLLGDELIKFVFKYYMLVEWLELLLKLVLLVLF